MRRTESPAPGCAPCDDDRFDPLFDDFVSKERNYTHFDLPLTEDERENYSFNPVDIESNSFWPLLGFRKVERKTKFSRERGRYYEDKPREIKFGSHADAALLEAYARHLGARYEAYLASTTYSSSILAYRAGVGDNVTQAGALFDEIRDKREVIAIAMDIKGFFDHIDHSELYSALLAVTSTARLECSDFKVFERMTQFEWVDVERLQKRLGRKGPVNGRLCSVKEFRNVVRGSRTESIIEKNPNAFGIPQGTPVSGLYANIAMIEFDRIMHNYVKRRGGSYRRYSDDLAIVLPHDARIDLLVKNVERQLKRFGLWLNPEKTEISRYRVQDDKLACDRPFQYLGFKFDGERTLIRDSSLNRYYKKMSQGVRAKVRAAKEKGVARENIFMRELYRRYTHFGKKQNFPRYAYRAAKVLNAPEIRGQLRRHMTKFKDTVRYYVKRAYGH